MKLIIAEKPSVARNIATAVGATKHGEYWQGAEFIVSSCLGHLAEMFQPDEYDSSLRAWKVESLPIIPEHYQFKVKKSCQKQFALLKKLMFDKRITSLINACDGDREGENIFRLVYELAGCTKPVERLWISSMEEPAILAGMNDLRPMSDYDALAESAQCREIADWLIGINATRLFSTLYNAKLIVGRVKSPTVHMVVQREEEIANFTPAPYWVMKADLGNGLIVSRRTEKDTEKEQILTQCANTNAVITFVNSKTTVDKPPRLFKLNDLGVVCNKLFGVSPAKTESAVQSLYEAGMATYPRGDSNYITDNDVPNVQNVLEHITQCGFITDFCVSACPHNTTQIVNNKKVSSHPAILPTIKAIQHFDEVRDPLEQNILKLLVFQLLMATAPRRELLSSKITASISGSEFEATGSVEQQRGWKHIEDEMRKVLGIGAKKQKECILPHVKEGESFPVISLTSEDRFTTAPDRYTEATLLESMETCGKDFEDENQREAMAGRGIGTAATRGGILDALISDAGGTGMITRGKLENGKVQDKGHLYPSNNAVKFDSILPTALKSPTTTGEWEYQLSQIASGEGSANEFIRRIELFVRDLVQREKQGKKEQTFDNPDAGRQFCLCPCCGGTIITHTQNSKQIFRCTDISCGVYFSSPYCGLKLSQSTVKKMFETGNSDFLYPFKSAKGVEYGAYLVLDKQTRKVNVSFASNHPIADCPVCHKGKIARYYFRTKSKECQTGWKCTEKGCSAPWLRTPYLSREISDLEATSLYKNGQTSILKGFMSSKGKAFDAALKLEGSQIQFVFPSKDYKR